jgi:hypothetical protein
MKSMRELPGFLFSHFDWKESCLGELVTVFLSVEI